MQNSNQPFIPQVIACDDSQASLIQQHIDNKTKPPGSLGKIEQLAARIARIQHSSQTVMGTCSLLLFAADHGIATAGVSAYPSEVTRQMVLNFLAGGAAANVFSACNDVQLSIVDAGVAGEPMSDPRLLDHRVAEGTKNFLNEPAMTEAQCEQALSVGIRLGQESTADCVAFGEMGIGNTSSAALLANKLHQLSLNEIVGRGTGLTDEGLQSKIKILTQAASRTAPQLDALEALKEYGGFEIAMMAGAMIGAAANRKVVLVDGYISTAAYLAAAKLAPNVADYAVFSHQSAEPGHQLMLNITGQEALLALELRLGEGTGAILAWPLLKAAAHMMTDMASFESANVSQQP